jgi:hypothetical protein
MKSYLKVIVFAGPLLILLTQCQMEQKKETLLKLKSIEKSISQTGEVLVIDEKFVSTRRDSVQYLLKSFDEVKDKIHDEQVQYALVLLKGMELVYDSFLTNYPSLVYNQSVLEKDVNRISEGYQTNIYKTEEVEVKLDSLNKQIPLHWQRCNEVVKSIRVIENEYHRKRNILKEFVKNSQQK